MTYMDSNQGVSVCTGGFWVAGSSVGYGAALKATVAQLVFYKVKLVEDRGHAWAGPPSPLANSNKAHKKGVQGST